MLTDEECYKLDALRWKKLCLKRNEIRKEAMVTIPRIRAEIEKNGGKDIPKFIAENLEKSHSRIMKLTREIKRLQKRLDKRVIENHTRLLEGCGPDDEEKRNRIQKSLDRFIALKIK